MSLGTLALIGICGLAGPLTSAVARGALPAVVGEILAGVLIGRTGLHLLHTGDRTLAFLADVGFAMLMFQAGMSVPLGRSGVRQALRRGAAAVAWSVALAVGAGLALSRLAGVGHPAVYAVIVVSSSAAVVLPVLQERRLEGGPVLVLIAQVTAADILATLAIPFVLRPAKAGNIALGTLAVAAAIVAATVLALRAREVPVLRSLRRAGKRRGWAIDLRAALIVLFGLAWLAQRTGTSLLIAGFGAGLAVAVIGGPKRLSTEVLGVAGGFFVPLFFVVLGARIDLRGLFSDSSALLLAGGLAGLSTIVHVLAARLTRQSAAAGLVATAGLGVPSAVAALGLSEHVISARQAAAIVAAALISLLVCAAGASLMQSRPEWTSR